MKIAICAPTISLFLAALGKFNPLVKTLAPASAREKLIQRECFLCSGPEGADDLCFHTYGKLSPSSSFLSSSPPPNFEA